MNTGRTVLATLLAALAVMPLAVPQASAQLNARVQANPQFAHTYSQAELDQMLAPIALYPDALLSQILMAATYPVEVIQAADWARAYPGLQGDEAVRAVRDEDWDPSVKSLVAFPQILQRMDEKLDWTRSLGEAFLAQEQQVMSQVQQLRQRAQATGSLRSDEQIQVERQGPVIVLRSTSPQYVYVPHYDPLVVYGSWWWPSYQPVAWAPWPRPYAVRVSLGFFFGDFDWRSRHVRVVQVNNYYYRPPVIVNRTVVVERGRWHHDPHHRRGADYRTAEVRQRFAGVQMERREGRRDDRQAARPQAQPAATVQVQAQPQAVIPVQRAVKREESRTELRAERQAAPVVAMPARPAAQPRAERRDERRAERRAERQAAPAATLAQPAATMPAAQAPQTPRADRDERREKRQELRKDRDKG